MNTIHLRHIIIVSDGFVVNVYADDDTSPRRWVAPYHTHVHDMTIITD